MNKSAVYRYYLSFFIIGADEVTVIISKPNAQADRPAKAEERIDS